MQSAASRFSSIVKVGVQSPLFNDIYHRVMTMSWRKFFGCYGVFFILFNFIFGTVYYLLPDGVQGTDGSWFEHFSFSVQTFSTVGYGMFVPKSTSGHEVAIAESMLSVLATALLTGLAFAKFSRTTAKVIFSDKALITTFNGQRCLMFRLANLRGNQIVEASLRVVALVSQTSSEGVFIRRQVDIPLVRNTTMFFALSWTVFHIIDESSLFYQLSAQDIADKNIDLAVSMTGHDETVSQNVFANCFYGATDFVFDKQFVDVLVQKDGRVEKIDFSKFNGLRDFNAGT
ncbi:MAG: ion channel [Bdellovibrionales bacterium]